MNSYKIEIVQTEKYIVDVQAKNEKEAKKKSTTEWDKIIDSGTQHYHQIGDIEETFGTVYDVTGTDDDSFINQDK